MKNSVKTMVLLTVCMLSALISAECAFAESNTYNGTAYFNGKNVVSTFKTGEIADAITELQPGDDVTFRVKYTNKHKEETDWYLENEVLQTLEKADAARKVPEGTGTPENGGYTYELIHKDKNGTTQVLFSNSKVGGEAKPADMEGLEQATNALDDWFYLQSLDYKESGELTLSIKFDGETEVNDYMDTNGGVMLRFGVNIREQEGSPAPTDGPEYRQGVKTGDHAMFALYAAMAIIGLILLIIVWRRMRSEQGGDAK